MRAFLNRILWWVSLGYLGASPQAAPSLPPYDVPAPSPTLVELNTQTADVLANVTNLRTKAAADIAANPIPAGGMTRAQLAEMIAAREPDQQLPP